MQPKRIIARVLMALLALLFAGAAGFCLAQGPEPQDESAPTRDMGQAFNYQGYLTDGDGPADGSYDLQFRLFDALIGGTKLGNTITAADIPVSDGVFTLSLNFGSDVFTSDAHYLSVAVRPGDSTGSYVYLQPRQELEPAPYAF